MDPDGVSLNFPSPNHGERRGVQRPDLIVLHYTGMAAIRTDADLKLDPVWFGIMVILVTEAGLITPPVGMNCYVVQASRGRGSLMDVFIGVSPYLLGLLVLVGLIIVWPGIVLWYR